VALHLRWRHSVSFRSAARIPLREARPASPHSGFWLREGVRFAGQRERTRQKVRAAWLSERSSDDVARRGERPLVSSLLSAIDWRGYRVSLLPHWHVYRFRFGSPRPQESRLRVPWLTLGIARKMEPALAEVSPIGHPSVPVNAVQGAELSQHVRAVRPSQRRLTWLSFLSAPWSQSSG
jgi:hypothetical protein